MNKELLFQLYCIHAKSGSEKKMRKFLRKQAMLCGAQSVNTDRHGNVLITKGHADHTGTYPCLAAHIDQVQDNHSKDFRVVEIGNDVIAWSEKCHEQQGLGADDKNGLFICLECLKKYDNIKVAFFSGEEVGCKGSSQVDLEFFKDCRFIIEPDRKGCHDLITSMFCGGVCSQDFIDAIGYKKFGYSQVQGSITDVGELVERGVGISCLNLSCGYYDPHTDNEYTILPHLENCLNFVMHIVENCTDVYPFEYDGGYYGGYGRYGSHYYDDWYGYDYGGYSKQYTKKALSTYSDDEEEEDYELMQELLSNDPNISFEEIYNEWGISFNTRDKEILQFIYEDVRYSLGQDTQDEDFWGDDADLQGELVYPTQKVS